MDESKIGWFFNLMCHNHPMDSIIDSFRLIPRIGWEIHGEKPRKKGWKWNPWRIHWFPIEKFSLEPIHWWITPWFCGPKPHFGVSDHGEIHPQKEGGVPIIVRLQPILTSDVRYYGWLVVWNMFSQNKIGNNPHPNWRTPSFFRGLGLPPTSIYY